MKKNMLWIAIAALTLPALVRGFWFYRGIPSQPGISTPDYQSLAIAQPPLSTPATGEGIEQAAGVVLFDLAHVNQYQPPEVQSLQEGIAKRGGQIESITNTALLEFKLKYASAYVVVSPSTAFTEAELKIVQDYIQRGGRLLVFTDATRGMVYYDWFSGATINYADAGLVNPLLAPHGITVNNDYLYNIKKHEGNYRNVFFDNFGKDELTFGLKQVAFYGAHSIKASSGLILLRGTESNLSSVDDAHDPAEGGAAISADGNVLAFGDFTFLSSPYQNIEDNAALIANIADFTLGGKQTVTLARFPYIFTQPVVQVYPTSEIDLTPETIAAIGGLQKVLRMVGISIEIVDEAPRSGDALVLGTFTPSDDLLKFTDPFGVKLPETGKTDQTDETDTAAATDAASNTISVKNFGEISSTGNGLMLFEKNKKGNTLTLLANTQEDLLSLIGIVAGGSLDGCVLQNDIAVCGVGYSDSYSEDTSDVIATEEAVDGEATPEPVATPAG